MENKYIAKSRDGVYFNVFTELDHSDSVLIKRIDIYMVSVEKGKPKSRIYTSPDKYFYACHEAAVELQGELMA